MELQMPVQLVTASICPLTGHKRIFTTIIYALTEPDIAHKTQFSTAFSDFMEPSYDSCLQYTHNHFRIHTDP
jgi:hypothetical protein